MRLMPTRYICTNCGRAQRLPGPCPGCGRPSAPLEVPATKMKGGVWITGGIGGFLLGFALAVVLFTGILPLAALLSIPVLGLAFVFSALEGRRLDAKALKWAERGAGSVARCRRCDQALRFYPRIGGWACGSCGIRY